MHDSECAQPKAGEPACAADDPAGQKEGARRHLSRKSPFPVMTQFTDQGRVAPEAGSNDGWRSADQSLVRRRMVIAIGLRSLAYLALAGA